ncbi:MAG: methionyl-tRNA formyltransferase [Deltaproteobacteria bacterium]|nr:MAG: methionyl-tRNA formyltransferase [Deltaproteobacteria bacterium]
MSLIYMGTPDFAVEPLKALKKAGFNILLVVTQPDRKKGRGKKLSPPPVKETAIELGLPFYQPDKIKTPEAVAKLKALNPDFIIVAAYGQILSKEILQIPEKAPINIHASILPKYRGASPVQHTILNMDKKTGITTMFMDEGLDTGDILHISEVVTDKNETAESLHKKLSLMGAENIVFTLKNFHKITRKPQDNEQATYAPLLKKNDGALNWASASAKIHAKIRALNPWPGAFTIYNGQKLKIFDIETTEIKSEKNPGTVVKAAGSELVIATDDYDIKIKRLQAPGKKQMDVSAFLNGFKIEQGAAFT